jgi:hypothetical protein
VKIGKRGIFFTLIAIMLMTILVVAFTPQDYITYKDKIPTINSRFDIANDFVKRLKFSYVDASAQTAGRDAMIAMALYVNKTGYFASETTMNRTFVELMLNGTINGVPIECILDNKPLSASACLPLIPNSYKIMRDKTLLYKLEAIENSSQSTLLISTRFSRNLRDYEFILYQSNATGPWRVGINMTLNYSVDAQVSSWNVSQKLVTSFSIEGIPDPLFLATSTNLTYITKTDRAGWGVKNLTWFIENRQYRLQSEGPSFLMRLYGNISTGTGSICCGLESMVNPAIMNVDKCRRKSYIDWCFYSNNCIPDIAGGGKIWNVTAITTYTPGLKYMGYKIDSFHVGIYNVTDAVNTFMGPVSC